MMRQILLSVTMTMETVVYLMLLQNSAQNALVMYKRLVQLELILQLEMDIAMMKQILLNVAMTMETVVYLILQQIIASIAHAIYQKPVRLVFIL